MTEHAYATPSYLPDPAVQPAWLPGGVEVQVAGESFHLDAIRAALRNTPPGGQPVAVLMPEPANPHDHHAVAVYVQNRHVGYLPADVAARVQSALLEFGRQQSGCWISCPAVIREHRQYPEVVLLLDPGPLRLAPEALETMPEMARTLARLLLHLDQPMPTFAGADNKARAALFDAEQMYEHVATSVTGKRVRPELLDYLLATSDGHDRAGRLAPAAGSRLRAALLELAESQGDSVSVASLSADAGMRAYKQGNEPAAITAWRRAVAAGSTDPKVADRLSIWLMKNDNYAEAEQVLHQALAGPSSLPSALRERLTKRLARCRHSAGSPLGTLT